MNPDLPLLRTLIRCRRAHGADADELALLTRVLLRLSHPRLNAAALDVYALIAAQPGINPSGLARERHTTARAAHSTVYVLERAGLIRTELVTSPKIERRCYVVETP